jgi:hypothetical protein
MELGDFVVRAGLLRLVQVEYMIIAKPEGVKSASSCSRNRLACLFDTPLLSEYNNPLAV